MKVKEESEKTGLKLNIQKLRSFNIQKLRSYHQAPSLLANRWEKNENSDRLYFLGSKVTGNGDCSYAIKRPLFLGRKAMTNIDSILKSRDITLSTKVLLVRAMVFFSSRVWT